MAILRGLLYSTVGLSVIAGVSGYSYNIFQQRNEIPPNTRYCPAPVRKREAMIDEMKSTEFDLIVIGGGATGSGLALDAATRGLRCALIDRGDFGGATSGKSTKLLHGGVRYLENAFKNFKFGDLSLVWEALEERKHTMNAAAFTAVQLPIILPLYSYIEIPYYWFGLKLYELIANLSCGFNTGFPSSYYLNKRNTLLSFQLIKKDKLKGSVVYYDGQHNDTRTNLLIALTSSVDNYVPNQKGAAIANYVKVENFIKSPNEPTIIGVHVKDVISGEEFDIRGKAVANCTGPFSDEIRLMSSSNARRLIVPSSGTHITLPELYAGSNFGMIVPSTSDNRVLFYLPWEGSMIVGTTDSAGELSELPVPPKADIDYLVNEMAKQLDVDVDCVKRDIKSSWSGQRPLVRDPKFSDNSADSTSKLSRSHEVVVDSETGLVSVMGGKWTTYRRMAQDGLDKILVVHSDKLNAEQNCRTKNLKLLGSTLSPDVESPSQNQSGSVFKQNLPIDLMATYSDLSAEQAKHLARNYGYRAYNVCEVGRNTKTIKPVVYNLPILEAEIIFAIRQEMAVRPSDILGRRTRLAFLNQTSSTAVIDKVVDIMAAELNWDKRKKQEAHQEAVAYLQSMQPIPEK